MIQIKEKRGIGVENPSPRSFSGGLKRYSQDETRNGQQNANRNPEEWGDFGQLQIQIKLKSQFESVPRDTSKLKSNQNLNSTLYREVQPVPWNMSFEMLNQMVIKILNSGEILVNCKFKLNKNLNLVLYREIPRN